MKMSCLGATLYQLMYLGNIVTFHFVCKVSIPFSLFCFSFICLFRFLHKCHFFKELGKHARFRFFILIQQIMYREWKPEVLALWWGRMLSLWSYNYSLSEDKAECLHSVMGLEYFGTEAKTEDGIDCQRWDKQEPHTHMFSSGFMGFVSSEHENYCRNPDYDEKPWCYTVNATVRYQYCDIQQCDYSE